MPTAIVFLRHEGVLGLLKGRVLCFAGTGAARQRGRVTAADLVLCLVHDQATQAYLAGDKALAKELGAKGRWHGAQMAAAHAAASDSIFRARNPAPRGARALGFLGACAH
jgi:hypothetical protein